jgi:PhoPQ-activated pathogenicity-related protein
MHHHYRSLGGWTFAFESYYELNITARLDTPAVQAMQKIIDPICMLNLKNKLLNN